jgi:hypothetical protein
MRIRAAGAFDGAVAVIVISRPAPRRAARVTRPPRRAEGSSPKTPTSSATEYHSATGLSRTTAAPPEPPGQPDAHTDGLLRVLETLPQATTQVKKIQ